MNPVSIFITYDPNNEAERTIAIRLHTIGAVSGFLMYLPDRYNSNTHLDSETQRRIASSDYVISFSLTPNLSNAVRNELEYAYQSFHDKSRIIVIQNAPKGILKTQENNTNNFTTIYFNPKEEIASDVVKKIFDNIFSKEKEKALKKKEKEQRNAFLALFGIGLGLVALSALFDDKK